MRREIRTGESRDTDLQLPLRFSVTAHAENRSRGDDKEQGKMVGQLTVFLVQSQTRFLASGRGDFYGLGRLKRLCNECNSTRHSHSAKGSSSRCRHLKVTPGEPTISHSRYFRSPVSPLALTSRERAASIGQILPISSGRCTHRSQAAKHQSSHCGILPS